MYKIAQNFPVIVKQPLLLISTNLLKITQGSLYFCTKVKLHENAHEFETKQSTESESRVPNKKESASSDKPTTAALSNKTATVATKPATVVASSRILANATPSSKIFTATITSPNKTTATVAPPSKIVTATIEPSKKTIPVEKPTPFGHPVDKTINLIPPSKSNSPESTSSQEPTTNLKLNAPKTGIPSQDVTSQNIIKPSNSGGVQFQIPGRLLIAFTCKKCNTRNSKKITKHAYTKGVVIIRCDGCKNNHLIADNLNWFSDMGKKRNIEDIMAEKGEKVRKIDLPGGISEYLTDS